MMAAPRHRHSPSRPSPARRRSSARSRRSGRGRVRHPRRRDPAGVRPAVRLHEGPAHPGPPRAGRGARRRGVRAGHRQGRRLHGDVRARGDQPGHPDRRRLHGLGADGRDHRPGRPAIRSARTPSRRPTSPASRCRSPSTTSWCNRPPTSRRRSPRRSTSPPPAGPARCWSTCPRTCCRSGPRSPGRRKIDLPGYRPVTRPHGKQIREAAELIAARQRPVLYVGGGVIKAPRQRRAAPAGRAHRHPGRHHADGARRVPGQPPAAPGHARHARLRSPR